MNQHSLVTAGRKITYPNWRVLLNCLTADYEKMHGRPSGNLPKKIHEFCKTIDAIRDKLLQDGSNFYPEFAYGAIKQSSGKYTSGVSVDKIIETIDSLDFGMNEFYSVFDVVENEHVIIDTKISEVLGIPPDKFSMRAMCGLEPDNPLHHPEDVNHAIRFALIAYLILGLPDFEWKAHRDYYRARFRIGTSKSTNPTIRNKEYVMVEKRAYLSHNYVLDSDFVPTRHFDRWIVYDASEFDGIKPYFSSDTFQSEFRNAYWYLLHAYLIGIPPKYLIILNERLLNDRNKTIAASLNKKLSDYARVNFSYDEMQIGNYFSKTIRPKLSEAMIIWDKQRPNYIVASDQEAIETAKKLGLLPIPERVKELIYRNVMQG